MGVINNLFGTFDPVDYFFPIAAATPGTTPGTSAPIAEDFVKLNANGYLVQCSTGDDVVLGRAVGSTPAAGQVTPIPTTQDLNGALPIDQTGDSWGGLIKIPVAQAFPGITYEMYGLGLVSQAVLKQGYNLFYDAGVSNKYLALMPGACATSAATAYSVQSNPSLIVQKIKRLSPVPAFNSHTAGAHVLVNLKAPVLYDPTSASYADTSGGLADVVWFTGSATATSTAGGVGKFYVAINTTIAAGTAGATVPGTPTGAAYWQELGKVEVSVAPQCSQAMGMPTQLPFSLKDVTNDVSTYHTALTAADSGKTIIVYSASNVQQIDLPAIVGSAGIRYRIINYGAAGMAINAATAVLCGTSWTNSAGTFSYVTSAANTHLTFTTANNILGAGVDIVSDGTRWYANIIGQCAGVFS